MPLSSSSAGGGQSGSMKNQRSEKHLGGPSDYDVFCHMIFEEFLMKKNLHNTLTEFRKEWNRPDDDFTMVSWYETAFKLRLPELVSNGSPDATVMENLVWALILESSIKNRRPPDVTVAGLATLPRPRGLPSLDNSGKKVTGLLDSPSSFGPGQASILEGGDTVPLRSETSVGTGSCETRESRLKQAEMKKTEAKKAPKKMIAQVPFGQSSVHLSDDAAIIVKRQMEEMAAERALHGRAKNYVKPSSENWIPEITRMKSLERDLIVAKENLADIQLREMGENREMKQFRVTDLERALKAESLGKMHRQSCGCCMLSFLPINLPLKVSQKAILDIRVKWSGGLNSDTVFAVPGQLTITAASSDDGSDGALVPVSAFKSQKSFIDKMAERLSVVPRCYDEVPVCFFCAQFFQDSDRYRPSYDKIYYDERKAAHFETRAKEKLYWDPLLMVEKDRAKVEGFGGTLIGSTPSSSLSML